MLGLFMQINFHQVGGDRMYLWYPVILIGIAVALLFNPLRIFYFRTRMWLLYSLVSIEYASIKRELIIVVALVVGRYLSSGVERLLHGRYVLLSNLQHECRVP